MRKAVRKQPGNQGRATQRVVLAAGERGSRRCCDDPRIRRAPLLGPELPDQPRLSEALSCSGASPAAGASVGLSSAGGRNPCSFVNAEVLVGLRTEDILVRLGV